jgi:hypothetical protein
MVGLGGDGLAALPSSARCATATNGNMGVVATMTIPMSPAAFIACPYPTDVAMACWRDAVEPQSLAANEEAPNVGFRIKTSNQGTQVGCCLNHSFSICITLYIYRHDYMRIYL